MNSTKSPRVGSAVISWVTIPAFLLTIEASALAQTTSGLPSHQTNLSAAPTAAADNDDNAGPHDAKSQTARTQLMIARLVKQNAATTKTTQVASTKGPFVLAASGFTPPPVPPAAAQQPVQQHASTGTPAKILTTLAVGESLETKIKNAKGVVLLDFYADWCGPCRRQGTILHNMQFQASRSHATIIKVNIDHHRQLAQKYRVSKLPTLVAVKQGKEVRRNTGLASEAKVASLLRL